ncbi:MAG: hypothetical protein H6907_09985 [Hyphomicrobiales bacterium]|nr:hypothetical protein [Hyphomicrobiales bacterium]MCP5372048.1 hypothetical protein [Hyphomicrobiales bacterium]
MCDHVLDPDSFKASPAMRAFLRAELAYAMLLEDSSGAVWNPSRIANVIQGEKTIPGTASDDTIIRFLHNDQKTGPAGLLAFAGFLVFCEYVTREDLDNVGEPMEVRVARAVADLHADQAGAQVTETLKSLEGVYRAYHLVDRDRLMETALVIASPDEGWSLGVKELLRKHVITDPEAFLEDSNDMDPASYGDMPIILESYGGGIEAKTSTNGVAVVTPALVYAILGGKSDVMNALIPFDEIHYAEHEACGIRARNLDPWLKVVDGQMATREIRDNRHIVERVVNLEFYPQGKVVDRMPKFASDESFGLDGGKRRRGFGFMASATVDMNRRQEILHAAEMHEQEIEEALAACADATERLFVAIRYLRADHALEALKDEEVDLDAVHPGTGLPIIHTVAALGMVKLVRAIIESGKCDLTVRDKFGRLASTCADNCAEDMDLRDELIRAQVQQFRDKALDPRRPGVPNHGSYILDREP